MKSTKEFFNKLKYGDFIIFGIVSGLSLMLFLLSFFQSDRLCAEISLDGETFCSVELSSLKSERVVEVGSCRILLEKDSACFLSSDCPDKLCVNCGNLTRAGDTAACVPERVSLVLRSAGDDGFDAVVF